MPGRRLDQGHRPALYEAGFTGALSVEHEDPLWGGSLAQRPIHVASSAEALSSGAHGELTSQMGRSAPVRDLARPLATERKGMPATRIFRSGRGADRSGGRRGRMVDDAEAPSFWVLADPDGNRSCICTSQNPG